MRLRRTHRPLPSRFVGGHRQPGHPRTSGRCWTGLDWTGRLSAAVEHSRRTIQRFRELGDRSGEALALNSLSCHYRQLGRLEQAEDCLFEAVALGRKEDLRFWEAANLADLAWVLLASASRWRSSASSARPSAKRRPSTR
jgi:tetratricopeptide (TPR) repeat protein